MANSRIKSVTSSEGNITLELNEEIVHIQRQQTKGQITEFIGFNSEDKQVSSIIGVAFIVKYLVKL